MKRSLFFLWLALCLALILAATAQAVREAGQGETAGSPQVMGAAVNRTPTHTPAPILTPVATHEHRGDGSGLPTATPLPPNSPLDPLSDF